MGRRQLSAAPSHVLGLMMLGLIGLAAPAGAAAGSGASAPIAEKLAAAHFVEPLVAAGPTTAAEDQALERTVAAYERRSNADDFRRLTGFLSSHPHSGWRPALLTNLGLLYLHYGYFSHAIEAWEAAWREGKKATEPHAMALIDRTVGELGGSMPGSAM